MKVKKKSKSIDPVTQEKIERETVIESPKNLKGCKIPLVGGCLVPIIFFALTIVAIRECKRAGIRLEEEKIKLEQLKDSAAIRPDTLKIGSYQKEYIPLVKFYNQRSK